MNKMEILGGTLAGVMFLSGCSAATETNKTLVVETATLPNSTATVTSTVEALVTPTDEVTATEAIKNIEGISTQDQIQLNINAYLSGKVDYSETGPNKDYLFVDPGGKKVPFSVLDIESSNATEGPGVTDFMSCTQEGIYLGSFVTGSDSRIISAFGTKKTDNEKPIVEFFVNGFLNTPSYLPVNLPTDYALLSEKNPTLLANTVTGVVGADILKLLSGKENKVVAWGYVCGQTPEGIDRFISLVSGDNLDRPKIWKWIFKSSESNEELVSWLQGSSEIVPNTVIVNGDNFDFSKIDWENIAPIMNLLIPNASNK
jgi:hypothetical protein